MPVPFLKLTNTRKNSPDLRSELSFLLFVLISVPAIAAIYRHLPLKGKARVQPEFLHQIGTITACFDFMRVACTAVPPEINVSAAAPMRRQNGKPMGVSLLIASLVAFSLLLIASLTAATIMS